jgi:hypothetical protein
MSRKGHKRNHPRDKDPKRRSPKRDDIRELRDLTAHERTQQREGFCQNAQRASNNVGGRGDNSRRRHMHSCHRDHYDDSDSNIMSSSDWDRHDEWEAEDEPPETVEPEVHARR